MSIGFPGNFGRRLLPLLLMITTLLSGGSEAFARSLYWDDLQVQARLNADGRLHLVERQTLVFNGDWNGGERTFRIKAGQKLVFHRLTRIDPVTGEEREVRYGSLNKIDHYDWNRDHTRLRWRSRLPTDPPFAQTPIIYELDYTLSNILVPQGDKGFLLDHDFAFPDRSGLIRHFTLDLELAPEWRPEGELPSHLELGPLEPGRSVIVRSVLFHAGGSRPGGVLFGAPQWWRWFLLALPAGLTVFRSCRLLIEEWRLGKFAPLRPPAEVTRSWVETAILCYPPEVVGVAWDDRTAAPEVAAIIARLVQEGKLASRVELRSPTLFRAPVLHLDLLVPLDAFTADEGRLIRALFIDQRTSIDTETIRKHYQSIGFDPVQKIRSGLEEKVKHLVVEGRNPLSRPWLPTLVVFLTGAACLGVGLRLRPFEINPALTAVGIGFGLFIIDAIISGTYRLTVRAPEVLYALFHLPLFALLGGLYLHFFQSTPALGILSVTGLGLLLTALVNSLFNNAVTRQSPERVQLRKTLAAGRAFMKRELTKARPHLEDAWYPYLLAFGLGPQTDRWFRSFGTGAGGSSDSWRSPSTATAAGLSGGSSATGFSGGGGAFGGGGSSGAWAAAVGSMAGGVASPGSSGGSGGAGGGGGGSGGGGGGGW